MKELLKTVEEESTKNKKDLENFKLFFKIVNYYDLLPSQKFQHEITYLKEIGTVKVFPYRQVKTIEGVEAGFDKVKKLPYVLHDGIKKLYFPKKYSVEEARNVYVNFIQVENLLGGNYTEKSPHQYQTAKFQVNQGDIVLDVGSAEALFSLDIIDKAKKVYIFEAEKMWVEPLNATFEPYINKVEIINKRVSNVDSETEIRLDSCIDFTNTDRLFIKMDIEGNEKMVLEGNIELLNKANNIKVACCTYHNQNDAEELSVLFNNMGYKTEFSEGYMIFVYDTVLKAPFFRHGLIRAHKENS